MKFYVNDPKNSFRQIVRLGTKENLKFLLNLLETAKDEDLADLLLRVDAFGEENVGNVLHVLSDVLPFGATKRGAHDMPMMLCEVFPQDFDDGKKFKEFLNTTNMDNLTAFELALSKNNFAAANTLSKYFPHKMTEYLINNSQILRKVALEPPVILDGLLKIIAKQARKLKECLFTGGKDPSTWYRNTCLMEPMLQNKTKNVELLLDAFPFESPEQTRKLWMWNNNRFRTGQQSILGVAATTENRNFLKLLLWKIPLKGKEAIQFLMQEDGRPYMFFTKALSYLVHEYKTVERLREENKSSCLGMLMSFIWMNMFEEMPASPILDNHAWLLDRLPEVDPRLLKYKSNLERNILQVFGMLWEEEKRKHVRVLLYMNKNNNFHKNNRNITKMIKDYEAEKIDVKKL
jgi:hypothetical protein